LALIAKPLPPDPQAQKDNMKLTTKNDIDITDQLLDIGVTILKKCECYDPSAQHV
jgi:hypothetical protein